MICFSAMLVAFVELAMKRGIPALLICSGFTSRLEATSPAKFLKELHLLPNWTMTSMIIRKMVPSFTQFHFVPCHSLTSHWRKFRLLTAYLPNQLSFEPSPPVRFLQYRLITIYWFRTIISSFTLARIVSFRKKITANTFSKAFISAKSI